MSKTKLVIDLVAAKENIEQAKNLARSIQIQLDQLREAQDKLSVEESISTVNNVLRDADEISKLIEIEVA